MHHPFHRTLAVIALALPLAGCSKKEDGGTPAPAADPAAGGEAAAATEPAAPAAKPPTMTPEMLYAEQPVWTIQMLDRGLWVRAGKGAVEHTCRQDLAMVVARNGMLRQKGKKLQDDPAVTDKPTTCAPRSGFAVCTFTNPAPEAGADPITNWVFTGTDAEPIMVALLTGAQDDLDSIAPELAKVEACPRPSDDPAP